MSAREFRPKPPYPIFGRQPIYGGELPPAGTWPPDVRPSALNPSYSVYEGTRDRYLAGLGDTMKSADPKVKDYPNELNILAEADDVQGNGIFDPNGSAGNVHADYGVFADHESLPGYIVRDQFYAPSEVTDLTTGGGTMYVPAGAVALDRSQVEAYNRFRDLWLVPPGVSPQKVTSPKPQDISTRPSGEAWDVTPVGQDEPKKPATTGQMVTAFALAGLAVGLVAAAVAKPRRRKAA